MQDASAKLVKFGQNKNKKLKISRKTSRNQQVEGDVMARTKKDAATLRRKANEILKDAERLGLGDNFMFQTTFKRYQTRSRQFNSNQIESDRFCFGNT